MKEEWKVSNERHVLGTRTEMRLFQNSRKRNDVIWLHWRKAHDPHCSECRKDN